MDSSLPKGDSVSTLRGGLSTVLGAVTGVVVAEVGAQPSHGVGVPTEDDVWEACFRIDPSLTRDKFDHDWGIYLVKKMKIY